MKNNSSRTPGSQKNNKFFLGLRILSSEERRLRGEVNIEFVVFTGIMMFILAVASFAALGASQGIAADNEVADARRIDYLIASEINLAAEIGDGYMHSFELPNFLNGGINYTIEFNEPNFAGVHWNNKSYSLPVLASNISGNATPGRNIISNSNGVITFG